MSDNQSRNLQWFYSVYTTFFFSLFAYATGAFLDKFFSGFFYGEYHPIMYLVFVSATPVLINFLVLMVTKPNLLFLQNNPDMLNQKFLLSVNIFLTFCCSLQFTSYWIETIFRKQDNPLKIYMLSFFIITTLTLIKYLGNKIIEVDKEQMQLLKDEQLANLTTYVKNIEAIYDDLNSFRHDYQNILISLNESIRSNDINVVKETYQQILVQEGIFLQEDLYPLTKLNKLETLPIKSIFSSNILRAVRNRINVSLEIEDVIQHEAIEILDYVRITSILLENAIEAAKESAKPKINIAYIKDTVNNSVILIVENSTSADVADVEIFKLFDLGFSTKGEGRGRGLATVFTILKKYKNVSLETEINHNYFRQKLIIKEDDLE